MDTERWNIVLAAIDHGSLCAAGEVLGYTVSGISRSVAALEAELGFPLLYRSKSGVQPTPACLQLLPAVRELLFAQQKIEQCSAQIRGCEQGVIGIGTAYRRCYRWISTVTAQFHVLHPGVEFHIVNGTSTDLVHQLEQHQLDFCLVSARTGPHAWIELCRDPLMALVPASHPLVRLRSVPLEAFLTEPYVDTCPNLDIDNSRLFAARGMRPNACFSTMDIQATYAMVGAGLGIGMNNRINSNLDDPDVCHLPLNPPEEVALGLAYSSDLAPAASAFLDYIRMHLAEAFH